MKKLILFLLIGLSISLQAQISTQKVVNTAVIYATNSPVTFNSELTTVSSNLFIRNNIIVGNNIQAGTNSATGGSVIGAHSFANNNGGGNNTINIRNFSLTGNSGIRYQTANGSDAGIIGIDNSTSNLIIHSLINGKAIILRTDAVGNDTLTLSNGVATINNILRWTNGITAHARSKVLVFSDEAATSANYMFYTDGTRFVSITNTVPILAAYSGGANESFTIRNIAGPITLVPDAPDGSIKWAPTTQGIIAEIYYLGNTNIVRSGNNRTQLFYNELADPTIPAFVFQNNGTNANSLFSIVAFNNSKEFEITTLSPGIANFIIGNAISDTITINAGTAAIPNGLNVGSGQLNIPSSGNVTTIGFPIMACIVTNVMADFPSILAAGNADLNYLVPGTITNMPCVVGHAAAEDPALAINALVVSNGTVTLRARNVGSLAVDQANLPYRIQIVAKPTQ